MLIRIVRMHFTETGADTFLKIFESNMDAIRGFKGCSHLQLLKDVNHPYCYTTLSHWQDAKSLENYRHSELFGGVWKQVKVLFSKQPEAFSLETFIDVA